MRTKVEERCRECGNTNGEHLTFCSLFAISPEEAIRDAIAFYGEVMSRMGADPRGPRVKRWERCLRELEATV